MAVLEFLFVSDKEVNMLNQTGFNKKKKIVRMALGILLFIFILGCPQPKFFWNGDVDAFAPLSEEELVLQSAYPWIIIKLKQGVSLSEMNGFPLSVETQRELAGNLYLRARVNHGQSVVRVLNRINQNDAVAYAEPDYLKTLSGLYEPNDPWFVPLQYGRTLCRLQEAYDSCGVGDQPVWAGIVDSGINFLHEEFVGRGFSGKSYFERIATPEGFKYSYLSGVDPQPIVMDNSLNWDGLGGSEGHGSHVAGIMGASGNNGVGICGVCPDHLTLFMIKSFAGGSVTGSGSNWAVYNALEQIWTEAATQPATTKANSTVVVNMSIGSTQPAKFEAEMIYQAAQHGLLVVAAAGNRSIIRSEYPAALAETLAVTAVNGRGEVADFSSGFPTVSVAAPGQDIWSVKGSTNESYCFKSGTSMATPFISGLVCYLQTFPEGKGLSAGELRTVIEDSVTDKGEEGRDPRYGFGLIDVKKAVDMVKAGGVTSRYLEEAVEITVSSTDPQKKSKGKVLYLYREGQFYSLTVMQDDEKGSFWMLPAGNFEARFPDSNTVYSVSFSIDLSSPAPTGLSIAF